MRLRACPTPLKASNSSPLQSQDIRGLFPGGIEPEAPDWGNQAQRRWGVKCRKEIEWEGSVHSKVCTGGGTTASQPQSDHHSTPWLKKSIPGSYVWGSPVDDKIWSPPVHYIPKPHATSPICILGASYSLRALHFFNNLFYYWNIVYLQCCVSLWCTAKWFSYNMHILFQIIFHYRLLENTEYSSWCYSVCPS